MNEGMNDVHTAQHSLPAKKRLRFHTPDIVSASLNDGLSVHLSHKIAPQTYGRTLGKDGNY
jgi:hypothetical protein